MAPPKFIIPMHEVGNSRSKPPIIEITQSTSQPADPDAPSFLTTLPAEIRNAVYKILFERDDPIEILDQEEQISYPAWLEADFNVSDDEEPDEELEQEAATYMNWKSYDFDRGLNLLRTCRQVYWEAIGTLYGANTFCVTAPEHRHNSDLFQIRTAADFVESIGTHMFLITELSIDLGRFCPWSCHQEIDVDISPLLRILWSRPSIMSRVSFTAGKSRLSPEIHDEYVGEVEPSVCATRMNQIIRALASTDQLNLRPYARFERLSRSIDVSVNYPDIEDEHPWVGSVTFRSGRHKHRCWRFEIDETIGNLNWSSDPVQPFSVLPQQAYDRILHFALAPSKNVEFDLSTRSVIGLERNLLQLDAYSRSRALCCLARVEQITLSMETSALKTSFSNFKRLREWFKGSYGLILDQLRQPHAYGHHLGVWATPRILLHFNSNHATLADLRMNVKYFICATYCMDKHTTVRISLRSTEGSACTNEVHEIDLHTLRRRCFILLSAMLIQEPSHAKHSVPQIWIDGIGTPIEVLWYTPEAGCLRRGSDYPLTATALQTAGIGYIREISRIHPEVLESITAPQRHPGLTSDSSLMSMWLSLIFFDWGMYV